MSFPPPRPAPHNGPGTCTRCHQAVIYCLTAENKVTRAVDPERNPNGNQAVHQDHTGRWIARQLDRERPTPEHAEVLHMPHVATCPVPAPRPSRAAAPRQRRGVRPAPWWRR
ncbi:hypothetical protein [Streptomyces sp. NBC_00582]|uniref:hypothetical protein n=1 Tax=Streptomyces sp. NBC_00582 TaxID=2975783 RepID=UPI002E81C179|nr:hypothetical protein [Streptomyces sp. NBC_00582]WUB61514.1 hypothetical protein OG852_14495 [Streptomyces sp. NBC_00582]